MFKEYADKVCFITPDVTQFIKLYEGEFYRFLIIYMTLSESVTEPSFDQ